MNNYPEVVTKILNDYLERLKLQLRLVPVREQDQFLLEIRSHVYEAYQQAPGDDEVARILAVLRKLGEPSEVVSDHLPGSMVRSGTKWSLPLHLVVGILIALWGVPLGFGGMAMLVGVMAALAGAVVVYFATAGSIVLVGLLMMLLGLSRIYQPEFWDKMVTLGFIHMEGRAAEYLELLSPSTQGSLIIVFAVVVAASGLGMLWLGKYLLRGLRFLFALVFDWIRQLAGKVRRMAQQGKREALELTRLRTHPRFHSGETGI